MLLLWSQESDLKINFSIEFVSNYQMNELKVNRTEIRFVLKSKQLSNETSFPSKLVLLTSLNSELVK